MQHPETMSRPLTAPDAILFDWHGTLVNTLDAMYQAIEDMLPRLEELGLMDLMDPMGLMDSMGLMEAVLVVLAAAEAEVEAVEDMDLLY